MVLNWVKLFWKSIVKSLWKFRKIVLVLFSVFIVFLALWSVESVLRLNGDLPGVLGKIAHFAIVDSLEIRDDYDTDEAGIMKLNSEKVRFIQEFIRSPKSIEELDALWRDRKLEYTVKLIAKNFYYLLNNPDSLSGEFGDKIVVSRNTNNSGLIDSLCEVLLHFPVNENGFRSVPFLNFPSAKKKILLIGDSFTWGVSANPITSCFADILLARGYVVYNAGIVGADPSQYLAIAEKWVPVLKPDVVIVNFFMGNDQMHYYRKSEQGKPGYHITNAGWLWAIPRGCWLDVETTYENLQDEISISEKEKYWFNRFCARSVLGTRLWSFLRGLGLANGVKASERVKCVEQYNDDPVSEYYLEKINVICKNNHAVLFNEIIPDYKLSLLQTRKEAIPNFGSLSYHIPENLSESDYNPEPDGHFNNSGHLKFANELQLHIDSILAHSRKKF